MRPSLVGGWLLSVAMASLGGYGLARSVDPEPALPGSTVQEQLGQQHALLVSLRAQVSALDLRLAELSRSPAPVPVVLASASAPVATANEAPETPEQEEARERARVEAEALVTRGEELVQAALVTGRWRTEDVYSLRALLPGMPKAQREAMLGRLITAHNEGRLTSDDPRNPMF